MPSRYKDGIYVNNKQKNEVETEYIIDKSVKRFNKLELTSHVVLTTRNEQ